jgi:hypothetical protein
MKLKTWIRFGLLLVTLLAGMPRASAQGLVAASNISRSLTRTNTFTAVSRGSRVFTVFVQNTSASDLWLHVYDATSLPANNSRPSFSPVKILAGAGGGYDFGVYGAPLGTGVTVCTSTTDLTLTNSTASFDVTVIYTPR